MSVPFGGWGEQGEQAWKMEIEENEKEEEEPRRRGGRDDEECRESR